MHSWILHLGSSFSSNKGSGGLWVELGGVGDCGSRTWGSRTKGTWGKRE